MSLIYCVEDDEGITELITCALKIGGNKIKCFNSAKGFYDALKNIPDLVLLDLMLPDDDGLTIISKLKSDVRYADIPVIILTARTGEIDKVTGLEAGADDYITKPFGVMELLSRIKAVLRRTKRKSELPSAVIGKLEVNFARRIVTYGETEVVLTFKEFELLSLLVINKGLVVTREQLMERVWGYDYEGETRTLDMHIKTLRQKLEQQGCSGLIHTVRGVGYKID